MSDLSSWLRPLWLWLARLGLPALLLWVGLGLVGMLREGRDKPEGSEPDPSRQVVDVVEAQREDYRVMVESQGNVRPHARTELITEVDGRISWVAPDFEAGRKVSAGDPLMRIEPADYEAAVTLAEAELAQAGAVLAEEQARSTRALEEWRRVRGEAEPTPLAVREPQLAQARANYQAAASLLDQARRNLARTVITAPWDGLIRDQSFDEGQFVGRGATVGELLATDRFEVWLPLSQRQLAMIELDRLGSDDAPEVRLRARQEGEVVEASGRAVRLSADLDEVTRQQYLIVEVPGDGQGGPFRINAFVEADIPGRVLDGVFVLAPVAVREGDWEEPPPATIWTADPGRVFTIEGEEQRLRSHSVAVLWRTRDEVIVRPWPEGEFEEGDLVCVTNLVRIPENQPVTIRSRNGERVPLGSAGAGAGEAGAGEAGAGEAESRAAAGDSRTETSAGVET